MKRGLNGDEPRYKTPEFLLIVIMLLFMTLLVIFVMFGPFPLQGDSTGVTAETVLGFRRDMFTAIVTVFAAWIGAGAAYYFGRENLKQTLTAIKGITPKEMLERKRLGEVMRPLEPTVTLNDTIKTVQERILTDSEKWFVTVLDDKGRLSNVIDEEAIERYFADYVKKGGKKSAEDVHADFLKTPVKTVIEFIERQSKDLTSEKLARLINVHVAMDIEQNCGTALERMEKEDKYLTFIVDANGVPKGYLTTADLRKVLFRA